MQFVGLTRFNLVTSQTLRHFKATEQLSLAEAKRLILDRDVLAAKLSTFENFCLPTYRALAERDGRSHGLVLVSHDLPEPYRGRLFDLCRTVPRLRVLEFQDDDTLSDRVDPVLADIASGERLFSYRYDDDDVLSVDFLERVEKICETAPDGTAISMNKGFSVARLDQDTFGVYEQHYPLNAYGLGVVVDGAQPRNVFDFGRHDVLGASVHHDVDNPSWIAFRHGFNGSQVRGTELNRLRKLADSRRSGDQAVELLREHFPHVELAGLEELPVLPVHEILDRIARSALRRNRVVEAELTTTRQALARTRDELRAVRASRSFRLARAIADTRSLRSVVTLPRRVWAAGRPPTVPVEP
ncbi:glycosyltransferase [Isoptericola sp. NPDC019482]|uniref:glycosyltransferase n=1 Tax=Isoptericola sp. NPDC019482 TaxID=3154688 RepID=UPI00346BE62D